MRSIKSALFSTWPKRIAFALILFATLMVGACFSVAWLRYALSSDERVRSLPPSGRGFSTYSMFGSALGRQYVRGVVAEVLMDGIGAASEAQMGRDYVIAETGSRDMGRFRPHATHRDGLSVDIHIPLKRSDGSPANLDSSFWNLWGYCWSLDGRGKVRGLAWEAKAVDFPVIGSIRPCPTLSIDSEETVDFEAVAQLLTALERAARAKGGSIRTVIVAPEYVADILKTETGTRLGVTAKALVQRPAWIRHDDHIHVDFSFSGAAVDRGNSRM